MERQGETTRGVPSWTAREKPRGSTTMDGQGKTTREYHHDGGPGKNHEGSTAMEGQGETTRGGQISRKE
jgi:hypothetical protein